MTLTHVCNTPWADAAQTEDGWFPPRVNGLSEFGVQIVLEMNRFNFYWRMRCTIVKSIVIHNDQVLTLP